MKYKILSWLNDLWYSHLRLVFSFVFFCLARILAALNADNRALGLVMASVRYGNSSSAALLLKRLLIRGLSLESKVSSGVEIGEAAARSIIVKWPVYDAEGIVSKGVIVITFTRTFAYYLKRINLEKMGEHFIFVLEPSWSGYADPDILGFCGRLHNVVVAASEVEDRVLLNCFPETFIPVSFGASDWVDPTIFNNKKLEKIYDSIYIANTNPIKRVKRYLDAVKEIVEQGAHDYVGCLVCASWGGAQNLIAGLVDGYQLSNNIVLKFSLGRDQVIECLNQSKVNILLSFKEGSNRSLFESMFCNTPVICLSENVGVNKSYINEFTGLLVPDGFLEMSLLWIRENYKTFNAAAWAAQNISPAISTAKLANVIADRIDGGLDAAPGSMLVKTNNPEVSYLHYQSLDHKKYTSKVLEAFPSTDTQDFAAYAIRVGELRNIFEIDIAKIQPVDA